ncbi:unnamed protein product [Cuscuta europaea]|uniref:Uncharacterized protein n=1 Tax=Cuscuta europaea TaxID=41803 RepID=A0A9P1E1M8_CUSEU|nr:unnamed protein product [Cuscuta europaea]
MVRSTPSSLAAAAKKRKEHELVVLEEDVEITKAQPAIYERKKRKRFVSKYHNSPFMDPCAKWVKPSELGSDTEIPGEDKLLNELKTWAEAPATEEPVCDVRHAN